MHTSILVLFLTILTTSLAKAEETYFCYLDKSMKVSNDGLFSGVEKIDKKMIFKVSDGVVVYKINDFKIKIPLVAHSTTEFAAKGGMFPMKTLHVWKLVHSVNDYKIQFTENLALSILIKTGSCILNE